MKFIGTLAIAAAAAIFPIAALAETSLPVMAEKDGIVIEDAYARSSGAKAKAGAAFMAIRNTSDTADTLIAVLGDKAKRIELHTHTIEDGIARMSEVEGGIPVPAGETVLLKRGGLHVMFMGLNTPMDQGEQIDTVFVFKSTGEIPVSIPVDLQRDGPAKEGGDGMGMQHGKTKN